ncbi:hypothetical protein [Flavobacterium sp.]|uniref:tetratricopeptide repeat protein n=1 Tax=Flavobacterium sp. TaxID=239 RepID=UPI00121D02D5|nr:hypothetical protein [Flavobacterium sp.]RZJ71749.1 MAG: hypothetical protein EOO49_08785 [Flavobacterium sp.]
MGLFGLFGKKKMTLADADAVNDKVIAGSTAKDNENQRMRDASKALTSQNYAESIKMYQSLADDYPAKKSLYLGQAGAGWFFLGNYGEAIKCYTMAMDGDTAGMMDDNIWEASEAQYNQNKDIAAIEGYLKLYPNGRYKKKAEKILQG